VIELIIFNTSQPSHPTIERGLYSPWFDEPVIELIIFNTSQPSHPTIEGGLYNQGLYKPPSMLG
jgi:hypothetical protein